MPGEKIKDGYYKIRPAGRHIITIGRDLIKDKYAAIVELVKNAYDADSKYCKISLIPFKKIEIENDLEIEHSYIRIIVKDEGHGMTYDTVVNNWMVPSTNDKLIRKISPNGRTMQGRKGVGRYSASIIGDDLVLQTIDQNGDLTTLYLIWQHFEDAKYLEDVNVLIENFSTDRSSGTEIIIIGDQTHLSEWDSKQLQKLKFELKKLIPPLDRDTNDIEKDIDNFKILLELGDFPYPGYSNILEDIEPYPLFELYDYRISGTVTNDGVAKLKFENQRVNGSPLEILSDFKIFLNLDNSKSLEQKYCGEIKIDFRVFDRDSSSIDGLIERGLKDPTTGNYIGKREARIILDSYNGIGVYRNGFRIRPLGDPGYDWLELDKERVQNPSFKIGSDQIIGFIHIESEESSMLYEKSARDGLRENAQYFGLQEICKVVLIKLEERRFAYRKNIGLGRNNRDIYEKINKLYSFEDLRGKINSELDDIGLSPEKKLKINRIIDEKEEISNKIADELKQTIAIYQGQATVGKIVDIILHEGAKPLGYFKNQIPIIVELTKSLKIDFKPENLNQLVIDLIDIEDQSDIFIKLFDKLDPLSTKRRLPKKDFNIRKVIENIKGVFSSELERNEIQYIVDCSNNQTLYGWKEDFYIIFTNLVDNSIYWLQKVTSRKKRIEFKVYEIEDELLIIEYRDNGPGIDKNLIESELIFEPEFSNKTGGGMGLGLAIAGEAIERNDGELKAIYSENGAFFKLEVRL